MNCLMKAWDSHEAELRGWLRSRLGSAHDAEDMLQNLSPKALRQDRKFREIENARAWLFEVARNAVADRMRLKKEQVEPGYAAENGIHPLRNSGRHGRVGPSPGTAA